MAPILACRLVSFDSPFFAHSPQILDLRERGSETVNHYEGTGMAAFTTKSLTQHQSSPFTPPPIAVNRSTDASLRGMAAFTAKSLTQHQSSPFTPPHPHHRTDVTVLDILMPWIQTITTIGGRGWRRNPPRVSATYNVCCRSCPVDLYRKGWCNSARREGSFNPHSIPSYDRRATSLMRSHS